MDDDSEDERWARASLQLMLAEQQGYEFEDELLACVGLELEEAHSVLRRHIVYILLLA